MPERVFLVRFKPAELAPQSFTADRVEFQGDHLILLNSSGKPVAMFLAEIVESWNEITRA